MTSIQAIILGITQGLTEFLPISSSGHLVVLERLFHIKSNLSFDVLLHLGTLLALLLYFRAAVSELLRHPTSPLMRRLIAGSIPTFVIGYVFEDAVASAFSNGVTLGLEFVITGVLLLFSESLTARKEVLPRTRSLRRSATNSPSATTLHESLVSYRQAVWMGVAQGAAVFPALSRSGLTISAGLGLGLTREAAVRFSFLLSIPAIAGATAYELVKAPLHVQLSGTLFAGLLASAVVGYLAIRFMMNYVRRASLRGFGYYAAVLGVLIITDQLFFHRFF